MAQNVTITSVIDVKMRRFFKIDISDLQVMRVDACLKIHPQIYKMGNQDLYMVKIVNEIPSTPSIEPIGFTFRNGIAVYLWRDSAWSHISINANSLKSKAWDLYRRKLIEHKYLNEFLSMANGYQFYLPMVITDKADNSIPYVYYRLLYPIQDPFNK